MSSGNKKTVDFNTISCIIDKYEKLTFSASAMGPMPFKSTGR